ncbi:hypothetical protein CYMTET_4753 [Cymbomonas tetramitiformis]|uniref:Uncharacterized protein n=1 Tax=Cymbomonas tetramitiformis TaxID=36881 RepID=A0AAE0H0R2_9CHLO|nr:hypothetical protein CYMTET_4753 [Cymbomonas tetramitiformis]
MAARRLTLDAYYNFLRGSAILWHAHLHKCPGAKLDAIPDPRKEDWLEAAGDAAKGLFMEDLTTPGPVTTPNNDTTAKQAGAVKAAHGAFQQGPSCSGRGGTCNRCAQQPARHFESFAGTELGAASTGGDSAAGILRDVQDSGRTSSGASTETAHDGEV